MVGNGWLFGFLRLRWNQRDGALFPSEIVKYAFVLIFEIASIDLQGGKIGGDQPFSRAAARRWFVVFVLEA